MFDFESIWYNIKYQFKHNDLFTAWYEYRFQKEDIFNVLYRHNIKKFIKRIVILNIGEKPYITNEIVYKIFNVYMDEEYSYDIRTFKHFIIKNQKQISEIF